MAIPHNLMLFVIWFIVTISCKWWTFQLISRVEFLILFLQTLNILWLTPLPSLLLFYYLITFLYLFPFLVLVEKLESVQQHIHLISKKNRHLRSFFLSIWLWLQSFTCFNGHRACVVVPKEHYSSFSHPVLSCSQNNSPVLVQKRQNKTRYKKKKQDRNALRVYL